MASVINFKLPCPRPPRLRLHALAQVAAVLFAVPVCAQTTEPQSITITGKSRSNAATVAGFGDVPLAASPYSATVINAAQLQDAGIAALADITRLDAGITDAYNPPGYWSQLAVRGFTLDNRYNYRRDGLPINAETVIGSANKQALEILKGTSGLQAGTSAPGGLVNLVVKRPQRHVRNVALSFEAPGSVGASVDIGDRAGTNMSNGTNQTDGSNVTNVTNVTDGTVSTDGNLGWRINASTDHLSPPVRNSMGNRSLLAGAFDVQLARGGLLEMEFELGHQSQPSVPGFSLLGGRLPDAKGVNPRINLNNQTWSLPVVFDGRTASLRYTQPVGDGVDFVAHGMRQQLRTDDRIAFPFGCGDEGDYSRFCSNGSFDLYDFRSEDERRTSQALDLYLTGRAALGGQAHRFSAGLLSTRFDTRFGRQAYNLVGSGTIDGKARLPADPTLSDENTNRGERSTELHLQDAVAVTESTTLWLGLRHTRLQRDSLRTDSSRATAYGQSFSTPWLALSQAVGDDGTAYVSWGQGVESEVAPNRSRYTNAGLALPTLKSRQFEAGFKQSGRSLDWRVAAFDTLRPEWRDIGTCDVPDSCVKRADGNSRHTGLEAEAEWRRGALSLRGSALVLRAFRENSVESTLNGKRPTNVPAFSTKVQAAYNVATLPGLAVLGFVTHEGQRMVLPDNSVATPGWTRLDVSARYTQTLAEARSAVWRAGIDNIADQRAWKEAPFQYGHAYVYPMPPRALHASVAVTF